MNAVFGICYYLAMLVGYILMLPILLSLSLFKKKYRQSLPARFFLYKNTNFSGEVWIHACSLGEVNSLQTFITNIESSIILTTITNTGYLKAKELFGNKENIIIRYLPFEIFIPFIMPRGLKRLVVLEAELWYMLFFCAKNRGAKNILLNARISSKSYPKYKKNEWFYKRLFNNIDVILAQSKEDKENLASLGANHIEAIGNIKALLKPQVSKSLERFSGTLIVGASTHRGEEEIILSSYMKHYRDSSSHCLLLAPRHPERFDEVWEIILKYTKNAKRYSIDGLSYQDNYSKNMESKISPSKISQMVESKAMESSPTNVILLDSLGELINIYSIASCVILGGSFVKLGGHNPLEPAYFNTKLISGEHIFNQLALFSLVDGYVIVKINELDNVLKDISNLANSSIKEENLNIMLDSIMKELRI